MGKLSLISKKKGGGKRSFEVALTQQLEALTILKVGAKRGVGDEKGFTLS